VPGNILQGNWTRRIFVDDKASKAQEDALLKVYTGQAGGPVADLAKLIGTVVSVERAPIKLHVNEGKGTLEHRHRLLRRTRALSRRSGGQTTLPNTVFSHRARRAGVRRQGAELSLEERALGIDLDIKNHNALQSTFVFDA
jgi:hypothetical protein